MRNEEQARIARYERKIVELGEPRDQLDRIRLLIYTLLLRRTAQ